MKKATILKALTATQNLSAYTLKNLKIINTIPVLNNPYSHLLSDIQEKKRSYKQSEWGNIDGYDAKQNVCETAMCIAGHFVNMAGKIGYDLKKQFGWGTAAGLIHLKAHPNSPIFNYNNKDNAIGLAYIEMMAEFESRENKEQTFDEYISIQLV